MICTKAEKQLIETLCEKVDEVLDNGDWPTEEHNDIRICVTVIKGFMSVAKLSTPGQL